MAPLSWPMGCESQPGGKREKSSRKTSMGVQAGAAAQAAAVPQHTASVAIAPRKPIGPIVPPFARPMEREASREDACASRESVRIVAGWPEHRRGSYGSGKGLLSRAIGEALTPARRAAAADLEGAGDGDGGSLCLGRRRRPERRRGHREQGKPSNRNAHVDLLLMGAAVSGC
jgi:hypothetical protein